MPTYNHFPPLAYRPSDLEPSSERFSEPVTWAGFKNLSGELMQHIVDYDLFPYLERPHKNTFHAIVPPPGLRETPAEFSHLNQAAAAYKQIVLSFPKLTAALQLPIETQCEILTKRRHKKILHKQFRDALGDFFGEEALAFQMSKAEPQVLAVSKSHPQEFFFLVEHNHGPEYLSSVLDISRHIFPEHRGDAERVPAAWSAFREDLDDAGVMSYWEIFQSTATPGGVRWEP